MTLANASTNDNGLIVYNDFDKPLDSSLKVPLTDLVTLENEEVSVPPHQTVSAKMKVKGLDQPIKGVVLGGFMRISKMKNRGREPNNGINQSLRV